MPAMIPAPGPGEADHRHFSRSAWRRKPTTKVFQQHEGGSVLRDGMVGLSGSWRLFFCPPSLVVTQHTSDLCKAWFKMDPNPYAVILVLLTSLFPARCGRAIRISGGIRSIGQLMNKMNKTVICLTV